MKNAYIGMGLGRVCRCISKRMNGNISCFQRLLMFVLFGGVILDVGE
jgi:hypothetical protein